MKKILLIPVKTIYSFVSLLYVCFLVMQKKNNYALFISHDMSVSGAPIVLKTVVKKSREQFDLIPIVVTLKPGELISEYLKIGIFPISTFCFENTIKALLFRINNYRLIFVNTIVSYKWVISLEERNRKYVWWIHEGDEYLSKYYRRLPTNIQCGTVWFVSDYTKKCLSKMGIHYTGKIVPYYISSNIVHASERRPSNKENNILIIGSICKRKNQLELLKACDLLPQEIKQNIHIHLIGKAIESNYKELIHKYLLASQIDATMTDFIPNNEIINLYYNADVCVCCSTDDPLPVTVSEALLYGCPVIVSSNCGQYSLIEDGINGYKYEQGNLNMLKQSILEALNCNRIKIGNNERKLFKKYFSEIAFEESLNQEINS